jgi:menaquinone-dependent protoporphyrinogen oxidase
MWAREEVDMNVLVAYASRHGATQGIAERIAKTLETDGLDVTLSAADTLDDVVGYDAFVIGSAAYMGHWLKEAAGFVRRHRAELAGHPVWFFSSGPVGTQSVTPAGKDMLEASEPKEFAEFARDVPARGQQVFYGAYEPDLKPGSFLERLSNLIPAVKEALPAGDFRDWPAIEEWAHGIALELMREREQALQHR